MVVSVIEITQVVPTVMVWRIVSLMGGIIRHAADNRKCDTRREAGDGRREA